MTDGQIIAAGALLLVAVLWFSAQYGVRTTATESGGSLPLTTNESSAGAP